MGSLSSRIRGQGFMFLFVEVVTWVFFTCKVNFEGFQMGSGKRSMLWR